MLASNVVNAAGLSAVERELFVSLAAKLGRHAPRNRLRSAYFDGSQRLRSLGLSLPPEMRRLESVVGWPAKAVNTLENRLDLEGFVLTDGGESDSELDEIVAANALQVEASQAHTAALVHGTAFVAVTPGGVGEPAAVITPVSARSATALWSKRSRKVSAGLVVSGGGDEPVVYTVWTDSREFVVRNDKGSVTVERRDHNLGCVPLVPLSHRPWLEREFGVSRISRPVMALTDQAVRAVLRGEAHAEFLSFPQRFILGADKDVFNVGTGEVVTGWELYLGRLNGVPRDGNGDLPQFHEFGAPSGQIHVEQLRSIAMMFAGETSIPPSFLGIIQDNPASADAIRAAEADLVKVAERDQVIFGRAWCDVARIAVQVASGAKPDHLVGLAAKWKDAATPTRAAAAQSVMQLVSAGVLPARSEVTYELLGYDDATIRRLMADSALERSVGRASDLVPEPVPEITPEAGFDSEGDLDWMRELNDR